MLGSQKNREERFQGAECEGRGHIHKRWLEPRVCKERPEAVPETLEKGRTLIGPEPLLAYIRVRINTGIPW